MNTVAEVRLWGRTIGAVSQEDGDSAASLFFFCYIFTFGKEGKGPMEGVRYGCLMGLFLSIPMAVEQYVTYPLPRDLAVIWFITGFISFVISGAIFATIHKSQAT